MPLYFPAGKLNSRLSVNRLSLVRHQPHCWQVIDGTAVSPVINTVPWLNKTDSFVSITFEPLKPSVNCICLPAEVYSRLFAKSGLICGDNSNILQAPGRHKGPYLCSRASPRPHKGLHRGSLHAAHSPQHSASLARKEQETRGKKRH